MLAIVNAKAYKQATGKDAVKLARMCERVAKKENANIAIAVQAADVFRVAVQVDIPVLAQHVDAVAQGAQTGYVLPESVQLAGAVGSLVNHSEHLLPPVQVKQTVARLRKLGLLSVVCAATPAKALKLAQYKPDVIAIEPPALIGGKVSVSEAKPEVITRTTKAVKNIPVLCGAGIHTRKDVERAVELGAKGILVASGVVKAKSPAKALTSLVKGLE